MNKLKYIAVLAFLGTVGISELSAQIKEEQLILNRKREPEVKKIEKKKDEVDEVIIGNSTGNNNSLPSPSENKAQ